MTGHRAQGEKFLPAFFVEPVELGQEFPLGELPLHMTYFPPVQAPFRPESANHLRGLINPLPPFVATVGDSAMFGPPDNPVHVKRIIKNDRLMNVHRRLVAALQYLPHSPQYRMPYNPHITIPEGDDRVQTGDQIEIGGFSIVEQNKFRGTWQVMAKIGLKGAAMTTDSRIIRRQ